MPFPVGMVTRLVSFAPVYDLEGVAMRGKVRVLASRAFIWEATGETFMRGYAEVDLHDATVTLQLPTNDQVGIIDGAGNTITGWTYTASWQLANGTDVPDVTFDFPLGPGTTLAIVPDVSTIISGGVVNTPVPVEGPQGPQGPAGVVQSIVAGTNVTVDATDPANPIVSSTGGGGTWGTITGTLSNQTDLQTALNGKAASSHSHAQSEVTNLTTDLAAKAPLASPAFTGNPTAPTPATADNDTSVATTAFVKAQGYAPLASPTFTGTVSGITKSMVGLGNVDNTSDANKPVSTAQQTALDLKAPLASPALTGSPTAPTPTAGDNDTSIATTAFVQTEIAAVRGLYVGINAQASTTYAPVLADAGKLVTLSNTGTITVTLPSNATTAFPIGTQIDFVALGAGMATFVAGSGATANGTPSLVTRATYSAVTCIKISTDGWLVVGDLA